MQTVPLWVVVDIILFGASTLGSSKSCRLELTVLWGELCLAYLQDAFTESWILSNNMCLKNYQLTRWFLKICFRSHVCLVSNHAPVQLENQFDSRNLKVCMKEPAEWFVSNIVWLVSPWIIEQYTTVDSRRRTWKHWFFRVETPSVFWNFACFVCFGFFVHSTFSLSPSCLLKPFPVIFTVWKRAKVKDLF